uniref:Lipase domain-containing protein n=1 Tax=Megaselia scalaris TaxID=36166 RepID=T1GTH7_MEGSC
MGTLGTHVKSGHADFYPNGGVSPQSNCVLTSHARHQKKRAITCSHSSAIRFFKLSFNPEYAFIGYQCSSYRMFVFGLCKNNKKSQFGVHSTREEGDFYLTTEVVFPYVLRITYN